VSALFERENFRLSKDGDGLFGLVENRGETERLLLGDGERLLRRKLGERERMGERLLGLLEVDRLRKERLLDGVRLSWLSERTEKRGVIERFRLGERLLE